MRPLSVLSFIVIIGVGGTLYALDLPGLLKEGPVVSIKRDRQGRLASASAIAMVNAPAEVVWKAIMGVQEYRRFMPKVVESRIIKRSSDGQELVVRYEIEVPLKNTVYTLRYRPRKKENRIDIVRIAGDLKGSHWSWQLYPQGDRTLVVYSGITRNYSAFLQRFEDDKQTITIGVNISSLLTTIRAIKDRAESR